MISEAQVVRGALPQVMLIATISLTCRKKTARCRALSWHECCEVKEQLPKHEIQGEIKMAQGQQGGRSDQQQPGGQPQRQNQPQEREDKENQQGGQRREQQGGQRDQQR